MTKYFGAVYHAVALIHHVYAMKSTSEIEFSKHTDQRVIEIETFGYRYFTFWNMMIQTIFLFLAVAADIFHLLPQKFHKYEETLLILKGYVFTSLMFPCSLFVCGMFWSVYTINREWVLPAVVDAVFPEWLNHSIHTVILIPAIMEILISNQLLPSFKAAFVGLSVFILIYDLLFIFTYYECGRWLYGLFYVLNWQERICFMILNYVAVVTIMKIGHFLQYFKRNYKGDLYKFNWSKLTKEL